MNWYLMVSNMEVILLYLLHESSEPATINTDTDYTRR